MSVSGFKCKWLNGINLRLWGIFYHQLHPTLEISYLIQIWQFPLHILTPNFFCFLKSGLNLRGMRACRPGCTRQITYSFFFFFPPSNVLCWVSDMEIKHWMSALHCCSCTTTFLFLLSVLERLRTAWHNAVCYSVRHSWRICLKRATLFSTLRND